MRNKIRAVPNCVWRSKVRKLQKCFPH
jgi:hypothetical protein